MLTLAVFWLLGAPACEEVSLEAEIGAHLRTVRGTLTCVARASRVALATYPPVLGEPTGLDDVNRAWFYPSGFDPAGLRLTSGGEPLEAQKPWTEVPARPGETLRVEFVTRIPRRNGTFGVRDGVAYLLGGWHPSPGTPGDLRAMRIRYRIRVPQGMVGFVGTRPFGLRSARVLEGETTGRFVPVMLAPAADVVQWPAAVLVAPRRVARPPGTRGAHTGLRDVTASLDDRTRDELFATLEDGAALARRFGLSTGDRLIVVQAPLRENLAERFDGGFALSDRAFHVFPIERFLKFHRSSVWREQLAARALPHCRRVETELPPDLVADMVGSALRDRLGAEKYGEREYAPDILDTFAVIPEIDALIYAPQISFVDSYFVAIDETPRRRWRLDDFFHERPRGKLLYEKLFDQLGAADVQDLVAAYLQSEQPLLSLVEQFGADPDTLSAWLGPYPAVDYAIGAVEESNGEIAVEVVARGPDADRLREPIVVEVETDDDQIHRAKRIGPGEVRVVSDGSVDRVEIDPDGRLVELHHEPGEGPRFNNRDPHRWRFLLNNIAGLIAVTNKELTVAVDFSLRRIHDLRYRMDFFALYGPSAVGGAMTGSYAFGREITPLRLAHRVGLSVAYERLRTEGGTAVPGDQGSALLYYRYDDRLNPYWSLEGKGLSLRAGLGVGRTAAGDWYTFGQPGASAFYIWQLAFRHAIVGRLRGDINLGDAPIQDSLSVGDLYRAGRGFERDEARGDLRLVASAEYRHVFIADARTDFGGLLTWTRFEGALFADALYLSLVDPPTCDQHGFFDVGYGLRFIGDVLGVTPAEITVDVGVPLNRCAGGGRSPVTIYVGFVQSFSSF